MLICLTIFKLYLVKFRFRAWRRGNTPPAERGQNSAGDRDSAGGAGEGGNFRRGGGGVQEGVNTPPGFFSVAGGVSLVAFLKNIALVAFFCPPGGYSHIFMDTYDRCRWVGFDELM